MDVLYKNLLARLDANVPELAWIDYDQGQIDFPGTSYPIDFPAVLIDFEEIPWEDVGQMVQGGVLTIAFRIAFEIWEDSNNHTPEDSRNAGLLKLQLINKIHQYLQGHSAGHYNALSRTRQFTEKRDDGLKVITMQYQTYIRDQHAMTTYTEQLVENLDVNKG